MSRLAAPLALAALMTAPSVAAAHGRPPMIRHLERSPAAPDTLFGQATWGMAISHDAGGSWSWLCAAIVGVDARMEDPTLRATEDGALLAGTFGGLRRSTDGGCSWQAPGPALANLYIVDLAVGEGGVVHAVAARPGEPDELWVSMDHGVRWELLEDAFGGVLVNSLLAVPGDPMRIYAGGQLPPSPEGDPRRAFALRSDDGGASFSAFELALEEGERALTIWAIDPSNPDVLYGQILHFNGADAPERVVRSEDAGETWETVLRLPFLGGLVARADGSVLVGSRLGGLHRAEDGRSFVALDEEVAVSCLFDGGDRMWLCADQSMSGYAFASSDDGLVFTSRARLSDIDTLETCPECSAGAVVCPAWKPDVIYDLRLDAALPEGFDPDGGTGAPRDGGIGEGCGPDGGVETPPDGCACRAGRPAPTPRSASWLWLSIGLLWALRRRMCRNRDDAFAICRG